MRPLTISIILTAFVVSHATAQTAGQTAAVNTMLFRGEYQKVIDTCKQIIKYDSLNPEIHYSMGMAYRNILMEDSSIACFSKAAGLDPGNKAYSYMLARGYYEKGKYKLAEPLFRAICSSDSTNWLYAYHLTSIFMQTLRYDEAIDIYNEFLENEPANCVYLNKLAWASLKKGDLDYATVLYTNILAIDNKNIVAIKNLAYLYSVTKNYETAVQLLTTGIGIDSSDMDLYIRRASLNYSKHYTKRALDDYLVVLASGDSSVLYLKRIGIGYCNNLQPDVAVKYLHKAYDLDTSDYETCSYLGQSYYNLRDFNNSICYYNKAIGILTPATVQLGLTYILTGESQKENGMFGDAIKSYKAAMKFKPDPNLYMIMANLYDDKLNDRKNAIYYYQKFLENIKDSKMNFTPEYSETVKKRIEFLKTGRSE